MPTATLPLVIPVRLTLGVPVQDDGMPDTVKVFVWPSVIEVESIVCAAAGAARPSSSGNHSRAGRRPGTA